MHVAAVFALPLLWQLTLMNLLLPDVITDFSRSINHVGREFINVNCPERQPGETAPRAGDLHGRVQQALPDPPEDCRPTEHADLAPSPSASGNCAYSSATPLR